MYKLINSWRMEGGGRKEVTNQITEINIADVSTRCLIL